MLLNAFRLRGPLLSRRLQPIFTQLGPHQTRPCRRSHSTVDEAPAGSEGDELTDQIMEDFFSGANSARGPVHASQGQLIDDNAIESVGDMETNTSLNQAETDDKRRAERLAKNRRLRQRQLATDPGPNGTHHIWKIKTAPSDSFFKRATTSSLENMMEHTAGERADLLGTLRILRELVEHRGLRPNSTHYKALILANTDAAGGSAKQVRLLLDEMVANNIPADSPTLHAALRVLAVHPDYLLRQHVLRMLRDRWLSLSPMGWHHIVVGLIRENQFEMALHTISLMEAKHIQLREWVFDLLIYSLCNVEEYDTILNLIKSRMEFGGDISPTLWFHLLDRASYAMHEPCVQYCWKERVQSGLINPSVGVCDQVLRITARSGNTGLANSVFKILKARGSPHSIDNYEALIDTYLAANDLENAIAVLCRLARTTYIVPESSTRSIMSYMISSNKLPEEYWDLLKSISKKSQLDIAPVAANLIFEYCAYRHQMLTATELLKDYHNLVPEGPDCETLNHCIAGCSAVMETTDEQLLKQAKLAGWFLQEMIDLKIMPNQRTYEEIILWCISGMKYQEAYNYFMEMLDNKFDIAPEVAKKIRTMCYEIDDPWAKKLQTHTRLRKPFGKEIAWFDYRYGKQKDVRSNQASVPITPVVYNPPPNYENKIKSERLRLRKEKEEREQAFRKEVEAEFYEPYWYDEKAHERRRLRKEKTEAGESS